jgi:transcription-repair coupling factor (superfamily II helicase)
MDEGELESTMLTLALIVEAGVLVCTTIIGQVGYSAM